MYAVAASLVFAAAAAVAKVEPTYVGTGRCKICHDSDNLGNQYRIWALSPHAKAVQVLAGERGRAVAQKLGIDNAQESLACLRCHTTGGGANEKTRAEGVGCEACHGPGSVYNDFSNHATMGSGERPYQKAVYRKAISLGMKPVLGPDAVKAREKLCTHCHAIDRPCAPEDSELRKRQQLPLQVIADIPFSHPVRR